MAGAYNSDIIKFYHDLGIRRIILPRDMRINEIATIVSKFSQIEFEVFIMRNGCKYSDSNCMLYHARRYGSMCYCIDNNSDSITFLKENYSMEYVKEVYNNNQLFTKVFHKNACGICDIKKFYDMGISSIKIVGRADERDSVRNDVKKIRQFLDAYKNEKNVDMYENKMFENCWYGLNCYYN